MKHEQNPDQPTPMSKRTDEEIRDRARELHEEVWVVEIPHDAKVVRRDDSDEMSYVEAWICLGVYD